MPAGSDPEFEGVIRTSKRGVRRAGYSSGLLLPLCRIQKGNCFARKFRRFNVSSSGGVSDLSWESSLRSLFARGCLTILAVGKAVSGELTGEGTITWTTLGFIDEVLTVKNMVSNTSSYAS